MVGTSKALVTVLTAFFNVQKKEEEWVFQKYEGNIRSAPSGVVFYLINTCLIPHLGVERTLWKWVSEFPDKVVVFNNLTKEGFITSHGEALDYLVQNFVHTPYILVMDYDTEIVAPTAFWSTVFYHVHIGTDIVAFHTPLSYAHPLASLYRVTSDVLSVGFRFRGEEAVTEEARRGRRYFFSLRGYQREYVEESRRLVYDVGEALYFHAFGRSRRIAWAPGFVYHHWAVSYWLTYRTYYDELTNREYEWGIVPQKLKPRYTPAKYLDYNLRGLGIR